MRATLEETAKSEIKARKPFYQNLWVQVLAAVAIAIVLGYVRPKTAEAMRPLGDAFIRLISMIIALVIFCTVVTGIAGMGSLRKVGRVGGKALLYFEAVTTVALAFTVGRYGLGSLGPLAKLVLTFWATCIVFVVAVLGAIAWMAGFSIIRFLKYIREEIVLVLSLSSSEPVLPMLMSKLEKLGCSKALVGLVMPTGYTFNTDGSCLYMIMAALFVAQATNTPLTLAQQLSIFAVATLTSKGASGVQGASFIALVGTLMVVPSIPVAGMALILGIDRFMSMFRAAVNVIGNGVATLVIARWEKELDAEVLQERLEPTFSQ